MFAAESEVDGCDSVLDGGHLSYGVVDAEHARGTAVYAVACGIGVGLGSGDIVSHPDSVGACAFEAG